MGSENVNTPSNEQTIEEEMDSNEKKISEHMSSLQTIQQQFHFDNQQTTEKTIENMNQKFEEIKEIRKNHGEILDHRRERLRKELTEIESILKAFIDSFNQRNAKENDKQLIEIGKSVEEKIKMMKSILDATNGECEAYLEKKYYLFLACRIIQVFAAGFLITGVIMISEAKTCQLDTALQFIDLKNKKRFCKHYDIKNTPAVWITGIIVIISNIVLCFCKCICCNRFWEYTRHKWTIVLTLAISALSAFGLVFVFLFFFIWKEVEETDINYVELQASMISSLKTSFTSDDIDSSNAISNAWNKLFIEYGCCAVNEVLGTTNDFDETPWCTTSGTCQATASQIPKSCCNDVTVDNYQSAPSACHASVNSGTYKSDCLSRMKELSKESIQGYQLTMIFLLALFIVIVQVVDIFLLIVPLNTRRISTVRKNVIVPINPNSTQV